MPAGDIFLISDVQQIDTVVLANTFFLKVLDDTGIGDPIANLLLAYDTNYRATMALFQSDELTHSCTAARRVKPTTSPVFVREVDQVGAKTEATRPANYAVVVRRYSDDGRPRNRGRVFCAGLPEAFVLKGRVLKSFLGTIQAFADKLVAVQSQGTATYQMVHFNRFDELYNDVKSANVSPFTCKVKGRTAKVCPIF